MPGSWDPSYSIKGALEVMPKHEINLLLRILKANDRALPEP